MIEAVYLLDNTPDIHLFTISINEVVPMSLTLSSEVKEAIPKTIEDIITLTERLSAEF